MSASQLPTARGSDTAPDTAPDTAATTPATALDTTPGTAPTRTRGAPGATGTQASLVLERYRLHRRLGTGGFGTVWMAHDERLDREVAVKIVPRERIVGGRFEREARAAARLSHPAIVTLYEAAVDDEGAYLVSELVRGETLQALLEQGRLSDRDVVGIAISLCEALSHAHAQGVVHRDVKPSNILVPERPSSLIHPAKLTDFGVARIVGGDTLTRTGDVVGTAAYMAPEQAEGRATGPSADLYALALVTYEALTGVNPVRTSTAAIRARRLGAHLPPVRRQRRELPRELGRGIDLALRPRPRERGTLEELRESLLVALEAVQDNPGVVSSPWPRSRHSEPVAPEPEPFAAEPLAPVQRREAADPEPGPDPEQRAPVPVSHRALAAAAAAMAAGWLASQAWGPGSAVPAPLAALLAAVLVLALPRLGWIAVAGTLIAGALVQDRPGAALVLLIAVAIPIVLLPRGGTAWSLAAGAPALGLAGLAGAWPAVAGALPLSAYRRAVVALTGWVWLVLASPLAGSDLYAHRPRGTPAPASWAVSLPATVHDVLGRIISSGTLAGAPVWAAAAVLLPWVVRRRSLAIDVVVVTVWSAVVLSATEVVLAAGQAAGSSQPPRMAILGAVAGGLLTLGPTLVRAARTAPHTEGPRPELP